MRKQLITAFALAIAAVLAPFAALIGSTQVPAAAVIGASEVFVAETEGEEAFISVMLTETGETKNIPIREYLIGCVSAEMSPYYHEEALKAQAVACYTYAKRTGETTENAITDDPSTHQAYISKENRKEKWAENYDAFEEKIEKAVDSVIGEYLVYGDETALAVYHSISSGVTQSAFSLWDKEIPYLQSVASVGDKLSPDYKSEVEFAAEEFVSTAEKLGAKRDEKEFLGEITLTQEGYVKTAQIGGKDLNAAEIRRAYSLRSNCFEIEKTEKGYIFTCYGYGHGVGMSQYGADYMARQGSNYRQILAHYYPGTELKEA